MKKRLQNLSSEEKAFLLIADSISVSAENVDPIISKIDFLIDGNFNWDYFIKLAGHHYSLSHAYRFFLDIGKIDSLPAKITALLKNEYLLAQARYLKKETELVEILKTMEMRGIRPIVVKGVALARLLYEDPGVRVSQDTDILVDPSEVDKARNILEERGYTIYSGVKSIQEYKKYHFHFIFTRGEQMDSVIELHWSLLDPKKKHTMNRYTLKEKAVSVKVLDHDIKTLCVAHSLWHMSIHLSYLSFLNFRNLAEIKHLSLLLDEKELDYTLKWAGECETTRELKMAINLSESLFGPFITEEFSKKFAVDSALKTFAINTYCPKGLLWDWVPFRDTHEAVIILLLKNGIKRKLKYLYHIVFPNQEILHENYFYPLLQRENGKFSNFIDRIYLLLKVVIFSLFLGFIVHNGIFSEKILDSHTDMNQN